MQRQLQAGHSDSRQNRVEIVDREIRILECPEECEAAANACEEKAAPPPGPALHPQGATVIHQRRSPEWQQEPRMVPAIEDVACRNQKQILPTPRQAPIRRQYQGEEDEVCE